MAMISEKVFFKTKAFFETSFLLHKKVEKQKLSFQNRFLSQY